MFLPGIRYFNADFDLQQLIPSKNDEVFESFQDKFGNDDDYLILLLPLPENKAEFDSQIALMASLSDLSSFYELKNIYEATYIRSTFSSLQKLRLIRELDDFDKIYQSPWRDLFLSNSEKHHVVILNHQSNLSNGEQSQLIATIDDLAEDLKIQNYYLAGKSLAAPQIAQLIFSDALKLGSIALIIMIILLSLFFQSVRLVLWPIAVIILSLSCGIGMMGWLGWQPDVLMVVWPVALVLVGCSDVIHFYSHYVKYPLKTPKKVIGHVNQRIGPALALTSISTAIGFLGISLMPMEATRNFGVITAFTIVCAYVFTLALFPLFFRISSLSMTPNASSRSPSISQRIGGFVFRLSRLISATGFRFILGGMIILILLSVILFPRLSVDARLIDGLSDQHPISKAFSLIDEEVGGTRPLEILIISDEVSLLYSKEFYDNLTALETFLNGFDAIDRIRSPLQELALIQADNRSKAISTARRLPKASIEKMQVRSSDRTHARVSMLVKDIGSAKTTLLYQEIEEFLKDINKGNKLRFQLTGTSLKIDKAFDDLSQGLILSIIPIIFFLVLFVRWYFKSNRWMWFALLVNLALPAALVLFFIVFGISLKLTTVIVFAISFGIGMDDSLHLMSYYHQIRHQRRAMEKTLVQTGSAILTTSMLLSVGFLCLMFSHFEGLRILGVSVSLTLILAAIISIILVPRFLPKH